MLEDARKLVHFRFFSVYFPLLSSQFEVLNLLAGVGSLGWDVVVQLGVGLVAVQALNLHVPPTLSHRFSLLLAVGRVIKLVYPLGLQSG